ncbi:MAG: hypothetical protein ABIP04_09400 [Sulfuriferula sp.]
MIDVDTPFTRGKYTSETIRIFTSPPAQHEGRDATFTCNRFVAKQRVVRVTAGYTMGIGGSIERAASHL